jgi:hypothetical protein
MKTFLQIFVLACAVSDFAQSPTGEIRVAGEHRMTNGESPDLARQLAVAETWPANWLSPKRHGRRCRKRSLVSRVSLK